jgi:uncharacterized lipoprotein YddW (UPF0748 family)
MNLLKKLNIGVNLVLCLLICSNSAIAQLSADMRGVWVTTLLNIDWPSSANLPTSAQKQEIISILDHHQSVGINAIFLQVRPAAEVFYQSSFEPWSQWLAGVQGKEPRPYYDPLKFWIQECHKRGMELHAWFNPFRASLTQDVSLLHPDHIVHQHPDWLVSYNKRIYFNPGLPQVRAYVRDVIMEVVSHYQIDGVHFDDYFYPYKVAGQIFDDRRTFEQYGKDFDNIEDWRRHNVSLFVKDISEKIGQAKPLVRFGISPFGVWRNQERDQLGSATRASHTSYDDLYADVLLWMKNGWIDYLAPQIYWHIGFEVADYQVLLDWWSKHSYGRHIYIGQSAYKIRRDADFKAWQDPGELPRHLQLNQQYPQVKGNIYFSSKSLRSNALGLGDSLRNTYHKYPALVPAMSYKPTSILRSPQLYRISHGHKKLTIFWTGEEKQKKEGRFQVVYRYNGSARQSAVDPQHIIAVLPAEVTQFEDTPPKKGYYTYVVSAVSKSNHESVPSHPITIDYRKRKPRAKRTKI